MVFEGFGEGGRGVVCFLDADGGGEGSGRLESREDCYCEACGEEGVDDCWAKIASSLWWLAVVCGVGGGLTPITAMFLMVDMLADVQLTAS